jgi:hypothetical protein
MLARPASVPGGTGFAVRRGDADATVNMRKVLGPADVTTCLCGSQYLRHRVFTPSAKHVPAEGASREDR